MSEADDARRWREHQARRRPTDQPRLYRVRLYDEGREVLSDGVYPVVLDLTAGLALEESNRKLDELLRSLLRTAKVRPDKMRGYYLDVREWSTNQPLFRWPVTWPVEP